jgi:serine/threonine-protein kinase
VLGVGSVIGNKYRLVRLVGEGGMGSVFEAEHTVLGSRVAIKVLHPELGRRSGLAERFLQEAKVAAQIRSPHVVRVADVDRTPDGQAYIVMDLLEGEPLSAVLSRQGRLPLATACDYTEQILEALEAAHALGVVHRDLKPENVFVTQEGSKPVLKLIDFGIAKARRGEGDRHLTVTGALMGTAEYMAPEQARSAANVDARADIYAVGVMLYEMIAGARPATGEDARVVAYKVERGEVVPLRHAAPEAPREIAGLVHHAMAPRPDMRFASATEMRAALHTAQAGKASTTPPAEPAGHTLRAIPIVPALGPVPSAPAAGGTAPGAEVRAPEGRRRTWAVAAVLLVLVGGGAGVAVAIQSGALGPGSSGPPVAPASPPPTPPAVDLSSATATGPSSAPPSATAAVVPALQPTRPAPGVPGAVRPPSSPAAAGDGGHAQPAEPLIPGFPTSLPGFPSAIPFPTSLPSGFPTALPSTLPSGFPTILPPWPMAPSPAAPAPATPSPSAAPTPSTAPPANSGTI